MGKQLVPKLRFPEFEGEWEEKRLGEIVENKGGTALESYTTEDGKYHFISIGNYSIDGKYIDNGQRIDAVGKAKDKILNKYDLVMVLNDKTATGDLIGSTILVDADDKYIYNQRSERLICKNNIIPSYLWCYINSPNTRRNIFRLSQGGTQIYVNYSTLSSIILWIPTIAEQHKIANFLSNIEERIELQQKLIETLEEYKKGMMQKIFSQEIRFKDDDGNDFPEWEEKRIMELGEIKTGRTPQTKKEEYWNGKYPFITPTDINSKYTTKTERCLTKQGLEQGVKVPENSLLVTCIASIGKNTINKVLSSCNQQINFITVNNKNSVEFLYYKISYIKNKILSFAGQTATRIVNKNEFSSITIRVPSLLEQDKIANFLSLLDKKIELEKGQLENIKEFKKGLMQKMFV